MPVEVQVQLQRALPFAGRYYSLQSSYFRVQLRPACVEPPVEVLSEDSRPVVADDHSVRVDHRHQFQLDVLLQEPVCDFWAGSCFLEDSVHDPGA